MDNAFFSALKANTLQQEELTFIRGEVSGVHENLISLKDEQKVAFGGLKTDVNTANEKLKILDSQSLVLDTLSGQTSGLEQKLIDVERGQAEQFNNLSSSVVEIKTEQVEFKKLLSEALVALQPIPIPTDPDPALLCIRAINQSMDLMTDKDFKLDQNNHTLQDQLRSNDLTKNAKDYLWDRSELLARFNEVFADYPPETTTILRCQRLVAALELCMNIVRDFARKPAKKK